MVCKPNDFTGWGRYYLGDRVAQDLNKDMIPDGEELIRRLLLHILPKGFMRIRHYGFLANRCRRQKLAQIRQSLLESSGQQAIPKENNQNHGSFMTASETAQSCHKCITDNVIPINEIAPR